MESTQIAKYAQTTTYVWNRTILKFKTGGQIMGYFNNNTPGSELWMQNRWNFVIIPQVNGTIEETTVNGFQLESIEIIEIPEIKQKVGVA